MNKDAYPINLFTKSCKNTCNVITHFYISIPHIQLDIHPGQFTFGTHHTTGTFPKNTKLIKTMYFCPNCLEYLLKRSKNLIDTWYYPIINCESLTRGLTQNVPISIQTILLTVAFTSLVVGIFNPYFLLVSILFVLILVVFNNSSYPNKSFDSYCIHLKNKKNNTLQNNTNINVNRS